MLVSQLDSYGLLHIRAIYQEDCMIVEDHSFGDRLEQERARLGLKKGEMAEAGSVSASAYGNYLRGERVPDLAALAAWANAGADPLFIATGSHLPSLLTPEEEMVLAGYRQLDARGRAGVLALIGGMRPAAEKKVKKTQAEMVFNGSVGDVKNIKGDYHETRHKTVPASNKKKRTDKGS